ncbi:hypothetical protein F4805DRAFT_81792 [Annulohypoxylon moriforme]|nr:hypothetical protein F4805DRAFT_81792 [Annulohypoxylon moriforme]
MATMSAMRDGIEAFSKSSYGEICDTDPFKPSHVAYQHGLRIFKESLTKDPKKKHLADTLLANCTLQDVFDSAIGAKENYESKRGESKFLEVLTALSQRLVHYGTVMDVLVQQHPEYVSLVWGAMKLIFGAIVEHERTGEVIAEALHEISDCLSRVEVGITLYPNAVLKRSASILYAHIVKFLIRAWSYYEKNKPSRALHCITNPSALRYNDLIESIQREIEAFGKHVTICSQAEIRDSRIMNQEGHKKTQAKLVEVGDAIKQMELRLCTGLSEIRSQNDLAFISFQCKIKHISVLGLAVHLYNRWQIKREFQFEYGQFWKSPKLREWDESQTSSTILIKFPFTAKRQIMTFCTEVVDQLLQKRAAVLWILVGKGQKYQLLEALKSLVVQALGLGYSSRTETTFQLSQFLSAYLEDDYLNILASLLQHFKLVYIIANGDAMSPSVALQCRQCLHRLSCMLSDRKSQTLLKVITTSNGPEKDDRLEDLVLTVERMSKKKIRKQSKGRARKHIKMQSF